MKQLLWFALAIALAACQTSSGTTAPTVSATPTAGASSTLPPRALASADARRLVENVARDAVLALKSRDGTKLAALAHPTKGVRFTPYPHVGPGDVVLAGADLRGAFTDTRIRSWGIYDGRGDPIELTFPDYWRRFVYDVDFANAPEVAYNRVVGRGNTIENTADAYPDAILVEYHFPGFDPQYGGLDWRSLRLLFERHEDAWRLVGIVHGQWTI
jgi:hypothetical protein